jgi:ribosome-binding protein aMBF1 (putative translation factor)
VIRVAELNRTAPLDVGERISDARRAAGLTQGALADSLSVQLSVVDSFEAGRTDPSGHIEKIAELTGRSAQWLVTGSEASEGNDSMLAALGDRVREARQTAGLTKSELAYRLGVVEEDVNEFESGSKDASTHLELIAEVTGKSPSWFRDSAEAPTAEAPGEETNATMLKADTSAEPADELDRLFFSLAHQRDELKRRQVELDRRSEELEARTASVEELERVVARRRDELEQEWSERLREFEDLHHTVVELATTFGERASALRQELGPAADEDEPARDEAEPASSPNTVEA